MTLPSPVELTALGTTAAVGAGLVVWLLHDVRLALYLGLAAGALFLAAGVAHTYKQQGVDEQAPVIAKLKADLATQTQLSAQAQADVTRIRAAYSQQDAAIAKLRDDEAAAKSQAQQAIARISANAARYETQILSLKAMANSPTQGDACVQADDILRGLAAGRLRDP